MTGKNTMNKYLAHLNKIEFVVTDACTGRCKHCSQGNHTLIGHRIDPDVAAEAVRKIAAEYDIQTVMTFGGEPLLYPDAVCRIHGAARDMGVGRRQVITNGYFTRDISQMEQVAETLAQCGVNDLLLSADAFHQETIPLDAVKQFTRIALQNGIPLRIQPAWLVSPEDHNPYNEKTWEILDIFGDMGISANEGNIIFPEGNALKYLADYFTTQAPINPYIEDPQNLRCVSIAANGDVLGGNVYRQDVVDILREYKPRVG